MQRYKLLWKDDISKWKFSNFTNPLLTPTVCVTDTLIKMFFTCCNSVRERMIHFKVKIEKFKSFKFRLNIFYHFITLITIIFETNEPLKSLTFSH